MFHERKFQLPYTKLKSDTKNQLSISDDGTHITFKIGEQLLNLLELDGNEAIMQRFPYRQKNQVGKETFALSPDGRYLATYDILVGHDYRNPKDSIRLWDTTTGKLIQEFAWNRVFPSYLSLAEIMQFDFLADGEQLVAITKLGEVAIWNTSNGNLLRFVGQNAETISGIAIANNGEWFVSLEDNVERADMDHPQAASIGRYYRWFGLYAYQSHTCYKIERSGIRLLRLNGSLPLGTIYVGEVAPIVFKVWNTYSGAPIRDLSLHKSQEEMVESVHHQYNARLISKLQLSHNNSMLAGADDGTIYLWNIISGNIIQSITRTKQLQFIGFSQDDCFLICRDERNIYIWDIDNQDWVGQYQIEGKIINTDISKQNRLSAIIRHKNKWSITIIDLTL